MYDPVCKFLVENFSADFAAWLLEESVSFAELNPSELSLEPIRADSIILLESQSVAGQTILHIEFQTNPDPKMPFRMLDYWVRICRQEPKKVIRQVVIYLRPTQSEQVYQTRFQKGKTSHEFEVIRLWEQPFESFLNSPGLLPFAVLSRVADPVLALEQVAIQIRDTVEPQAQAGIIASTAIMAGLLLEESLIQRIIGMDLLEQSSIYQSIKQKGVQQAVQQQLQEEHALALRMLAQSLGKIPASLESNVNQLSISQTRGLIEATLRFSSLPDLESWLAIAAKNTEPNTTDS